MRGSGSSRLGSRCSSRGTPRSGRPSCSQRRCSCWRSASRRARGSCRLRSSGRGARIVFGRMAQPIPRWQPYAEAEALLRAVGVEQSELPVEEYDNGAQHVYVALESEEAVAGVRANLAPLGLPEALGVNCFSGSGTRWKTRMFGLGGIPEDPATGSAAGPLAVHLARHGRIGFGEEIEITQGVEIGRPSKLFAVVHGSADAVERVEVGGSAVTVAHGEFRLPNA